MTPEEQTATLNRLREFLQSIAILAVQAQDRLGSPDVVADLLMDIESDVNMAQSLNEELSK